MNNDRELLELAAKASGIAGNLRQFQMPYSNATHIGIGKNRWNPLESDADALRLAVKLGIDISFGIFASQINAEIYDWVEEEVKAEVHEGGRDDPYAATRRAIVRAAAEIGKEQK